MRLIAFVTGSGSIARILAYLGEPTQAPRIAPPTRGPSLEEDFDTREGDTFALSERAASESQARKWPCWAREGRNNRTLPANPGMDASHPYPSMSSTSGLSW